MSPAWRAACLGASGRIGEHRGDPVAHQRLDLLAQLGDLFLGVGGFVGHRVHLQGGHGPGLPSFLVPSRNASPGSRLPCVASPGDRNDPERPGNAALPAALPGRSVRQHSRTPEPDPDERSLDPGGRDARGARDNVRPLARDLTIVSRAASIRRRSSGSTSSRSRRSPASRPGASWDGGLDVLRAKKDLRRRAAGTSWSCRGTSCWPAARKGCWRSSTGRRSAARTTICRKA